MKLELVITGAGVVSAIGVGKSANLESLLHARSGVAPVRYLATDLKDFPVGEVKLSNEELGARCGAPAEWPRTTLLSICALQEALQEAGLADGKGMRLIGGTTVGGMDLTEKIFPNYSPNHGCGASTDLAALFIGGFEMKRVLMIVTVFMATWLLQSVQAEGHMYSIEELNRMG